VTGIEPGPIHVRFVVNKVTLKQTNFRVLRFYPLSSTNAPWSSSSSRFSNQKWAKAGNLPTKRRSSRKKFSYTSKVNRDIKTNIINLCQNNLISHTKQFNITYKDIVPLLGGLLPLIPGWIFGYNLLWDEIFLHQKIATRYATTVLHHFSIHLSKQGQHSTLSTSYYGHEIH
jgi:hypothetical protein